MEDLFKEEPRGKKVTISCKHCKTKKVVRFADVKRGWGLYCSKRCKALDQKLKNKR